MPSIRGGALVLLLGASVFLGCTPPPPSNVPIKDMHANGSLDLGGNEDLSGADLSGQDLSGEDLTGVPRTWTYVTPAGVTTDFYSVWSNGSDLVYAVGAGPILFKSVAGGAFISDTSTKPTIPSNFNLLGVHGIAPGPPTTPLYAVGKLGKIWSYAGDLAASSGAWSEETSGTATQTIFGVWVAPDGVAFCVGNGYAGKRSGSTTWSALTGIGADVAYNVWGSKAGSYSIYAVGAGGKIWHSTGGAFTAETSGVTTDLIGVYGYSATDIYAVGLGGVILHSTGLGVWTKQTAPSGADLEAVGGPNADEVYVVGAAGTVLKKTGAASTTWTQEVLPNPAETRVFNGVWGGPSAIYVVGQAGVILTK